MVILPQHKSKIVSYKIYICLQQGKSAYSLWFHILKVHYTMGRFFFFIVNIWLSFGEPRMGATLCVSSAGDCHASNTLNKKGLSAKQ